MSNIDYTKLTNKHRVKVRFTSTGDEVELGLVAFDRGELYLASGWRVADARPGATYPGAFEILEVIEPRAADLPLRTVLRGPSATEALVKIARGDKPWLGCADAFDEDRHWFSDYGAQELLDKHDWKVEAWTTQN